MKHFEKFWIVALLVGAIAPTPALAQTGTLCEWDTNYEPPAGTTRTVELADFNIAVSIPENYRTMRRQDGAVEILHPNDFEMLQCIASGGYGAGGYYSERIQQVTPDPMLSLQEQALQQMREGNANPTTRYQSNGLNGYIVPSMSGYGVMFLGTVPGSNQLLEVTAGCDCDVDADLLVDLLSRIQPLQ
ncbi:MAG: hypothetical protein ACFBSF_09715 [Leptolyngbyaceae cyanobacterium]